MTTIGKSLFRGKSSDSGGPSAGSSLEELGIDPATLPEKLRGLDERFIANILSEIIDHGAPVTWDDIGRLSLSLNGLIGSRSGPREAVRDGGGDLADAAAGPLHGAAVRAAGIAAVRAAGDGEDAAGQGHRPRGRVHLLQHQRLLPHQQVDGRGREDGPRALRRRRDEGRRSPAGKSPVAVRHLHRRNRLAARNAKVETWKRGN